MKTIGDVRVARQKLEEKILEVMLAFNNETDTPICEVIVDALAKIDTMETHPKEEIIGFDIEGREMTALQTLKHNHVFSLCEANIVKSFTSHVITGEDELEVDKEFVFKLAEELRQYAEEKM